MVIMYHAQSINALIMVILNPAEGPLNVAPVPHSVHRGPTNGYPVPTQSIEKKNDILYQAKSIDALLMAILYS